MILMLLHCTAMVPTSPDPHWRQSWPHRRPAWCWAWGCCSGGCRQWRRCRWCWSPPSRCPAAGQSSGCGEQEAGLYCGGSAPTYSGSETFSSWAGDEQVRSSEWNSVNYQIKVCVMMRIMIAATATHWDPYFLEVIIVAECSFNCHLQHHQSPGSNFSQIHSSLIQRDKFFTQISLTVVSSGIWKKNE